MCDMRVLELYCGIGGMHYALQDTGLPFKLVAAVDINTVTNAIYAANFPTEVILNRCIESLTVDELDAMDIDMVVMSPPCQPFTRVGLQKGLQDARSSSFIKLLQVIERLPSPPTYILVENVKGFEISEAQSLLVNTLTRIGYAYQQFLITPTQLGIPNSRLRYYLIAKLQPKKFVFTTSPEMMLDLPECVKQYCKYMRSTAPEGKPLEESTASSDDHHHMLRYSCNEVSQFLDERADGDNDADELQGFLVPRKFFHLYWTMDIITPQSTGSCCFTKRYGRHMTGAGSVIQQSQPDDKSDLTKPEDKTLTEEKASAIAQLRLRFFSPREIANLLCFPQEFKFPKDTTTMQRYRALGNSLNVHVVSVLLRLLVMGDACD